MTGSSPGASGFQASSSLKVSTLCYSSQRSGMHEDFWLGERKSVMLTELEFQLQ